MIRGGDAARPPRQRRLVLSRLTRARYHHPLAGLTGVWELEGVAAQYVQLAGQCTRALAASGRSATRTRARTLVAARKQLRLIEGEDPMLPVELLPRDWPRPQAVEAVQALWGCVRREIHDQARLA